MKRNYCKEHASFSRLYRIRTSLANKQEYESNSHKQTTLEQYTFTHTTIQQEKLFRVPRHSGATNHSFSSNSNGAKSAKDLINLLPDGSCTVAARIWLSVELWSCWILANFQVPRGSSSLSMTTSPTCGCFSFKGCFCLTSYLCCSRRESRYSSPPFPESIQVLNAL